VLDTDASFLGVGSVLSQLQDDVERVIAYSSRRLSDSERQYSTTCLELLAAVYTDFDNTSSTCWVVSSRGERIMPLYNGCGVYPNQSASKRAG